MALTRLMNVDGNIGMNNPETLRDLTIDLRRMDKLGHENRPSGANAYEVHVSRGIETGFVFEIQYGQLRGNDFTPLGVPSRYSTETLPYL
ncbi:MAG: hypothetical protein HY365_00465 [Candidatus Aenigmarchaeota archaeon]|nr:hypothetical protein [Candidatus Aenigmarchaeota archaeon]